MNRDTKFAIGGWIVTAAVITFAIMASRYHNSYVPPPTSYWPTEPFMVNTAQIVRMERAGLDGTRIWFGERRAQSTLFAEQPPFFEGPTRILSATRIKEWDR